MQELIRPNLQPVFSSIELFNCRKAKTFLIVRTTYSRLDKLSPDGATSPPVSCGTPAEMPEQLCLLSRLYTNVGASLSGGFVVPVSGSYSGSSQQQQQHRQSSASSMFLPPQSLSGSSGMMMPPPPSSRSGSNSTNSGSSSRHAGMMPAPPSKARLTVLQEEKKRAAMQRALEQQEREQRAKAAQDYYATPGLFQAPERVSAEEAGQVAQVLGTFSDAKSVINSKTSCIGIEYQPPTPAPSLHHHIIGEWLLGALTTLLCYFHFTVLYSSACR